MLRKNIFSTAFFSLLLMLTIASVNAGTLPDFSTLAKQNRASVVNITVVMKQQQRQPTIFDNFLNQQRPNQGGYTPPPKAQGSGFIISDDGYILTNRHVVKDAQTVKVYLFDRREFDAKVIGTDEGTDVALIKINAKNLPKVSVGDSDALQTGQWVFAMGAPFGFDHTVTAGIVSATNRQIGREQYVPFIQTDVAINPGNSGGPLLNMQGEVVGINSQIWTRSGGYMGISFAIPIELAMNVAEQLKKTGKVSRGYLGVTYQDIDYNLAKSFGLKEIYGAIIPEVTKNGPADKSGIKPGDIVLKIKGKKIKRAADLPFTIGRTRPGDKVNFEILRDGEKKSLQITVGERPDAQKTADANHPELSNRLGIRVSKLDPRLEQMLGESGVQVTQLENGPAASAGIREGDIILSMNRNRIESINDFDSVIKNLPVAKGFPVLVVRPRLGKRFFVVTIPK